MNNIKREGVFVGEVIREPDDTKYVALGEEGPEVEVVEVAPAPQTDTERITAIEKAISQLALSLDSIFSMLKKMRDKDAVRKDFAIAENIERAKSDMKIPEGTVLIGETRGVSYYCEVKSGAFYVGVTQYPTLSAAAQGVSGVRRSGWAFWRLSGGKHNGRTVKEVFKS